jgi:hypothetical protein
MSRWVAIAAMAFLAMGTGCGFPVDHFENVWAVRKHTLGKSPHVYENRTLTVGMSTDEVELVAGEFLVKSALSQRRELKHQFAHLPPIDTRRLFLYVEEGVLRAIIVRGWMVQYP